MTREVNIYIIIGLGLMVLLTFALLELNDLKRVVREELRQIARAIERRDSDG